VVEELEAYPEWFTWLTGSFNGTIFLILVVILGAYAYRVFRLVQKNEIEVIFNIYFSKEESFIKINIFFV
jgi:hypothetical protein